MGAIALRGPGHAIDGAPLLVTGPVVRAVQVLDRIPTQTMPKTHNFARLAALMLSLLTGGCGTDPTSPASAWSALNTAVGRWSNAGLVNYRFRSTVSCFCSPEFTAPMLVTVRGGVVTEIVTSATGASQPITYRQTIERMFSVVRSEIRERPERLQVTYDPTLGFPRTLTYGTPENDGGGYISIDSVVAIP